MLERIGLGRRAAVAVASALALVLVACGGETSSGGVQAQPGVYPLMLIGAFLIIGGAVATWVIYRGGGVSKRKNKKLYDDAEADNRRGADDADDDRNK
ncbi:hypothetical protein ACFWGD_12390 [Corynebacterium sp. NPDC060344]|uniref:hypothetical protein n=1 Tax=Corynebacterium sp. NPDC060344 TaxID=3347101 RepID=UPI00364A57C1